MSSGGKLLSSATTYNNKSIRLCSGVEILIEPAGWRDLQAVRTLEQEVYAQDAYPFLEILGMLTLPGFIRKKAMAGSRLAGFIFAEGFSDPEHDWITAIRVSRDYQRCGIGTRLLLDSEQYLKKKSIRLCVRRSNQPAIQLYTKCGYRQINLWEKYYHDGEDAIIMEKVR